MSFDSYCYAYNNNATSVGLNVGIPLIPANAITKNMTCGNSYITVQNSGFYFIFFAIFQQTTSGNSGTQAFALYSQNRGYISNTMYFSNVGIGTANGGGPTNNYNNIYGNCITFIEAGDSISVLYVIDNVASFTTNTFSVYNSNFGLNNANLQTTSPGSIADSINFSICMLQLNNISYAFITNLSTYSGGFYGYQSNNASYAFVFNNLTPLGIPQTINLQNEELYGGNQISTVTNSEGDFSVLPLSTTGDYNIESQVPNQTSNGTPFYIVYTLTCNDQGGQLGASVTPRLYDPNPEYPYIYAAGISTPDTNGHPNVPEQSIYGNGIVTSTSSASQIIILGFCIVNVLQTANIGLINAEANNSSVTGGITSVELALFYNAAVSANQVLGNQLQALGNNISLSLFEIPPTMSYCNGYANITSGTPIINGVIFPILVMPESLNFQLSPGAGIIQYNGDVGIFYVTFSVVFTGSTSGPPSIALEYFTISETDNTLIYGDIIPASLMSSYVNYTNNNNYIITGQAIVTLGPFNQSLNQFNCLGIVYPGQTNVQNQLYLFTVETGEGTGTITTSIVAIQIG
jgi:hypothetical protein